MHFNKGMEVPQSTYQAVGMAEIRKCIIPLRTTPSGISLVDCMQVSTNPLGLY